MTNIVIAAYQRSAFQLAGKGAFTRVRGDDLAAAVVRGLVDKTGIDPATIEDLIVGCAFPEGEQGFNVARLIGFLADLPVSVAGVTVNRFCGSSMQAIHQAAGAILAGAGEAFIAAGVESMSRVPMTGFNPMPNAELAAKNAGAYMGMGVTAENVAAKYQVTRPAMEEMALASHQKAAAAQAAGKFKDEIIAYNGVDTDGTIRPETNLAKLAELKPSFKEDGLVTAGTSSPLTDGASAVLVCTEDYAKRNNLKPLARIKSMSVAGCAPEIMGIGPVPAAQKALARAGLKIDQIDIVELNEAFAAQALACVRDLGIDMEKLNLDGGAIAMGHPLGASGARITGKAASLLQREKKKYALASMCIGGGQGIATVLEAM